MRRGSWWGVMVRVGGGKVEGIEAGEGGGERGGWLSEGGGGVVEEEDGGVGGERRGEGDGVDWGELGTCEMKLLR